MHTEIYSGNLKGRDKLDDLGIDGRVMLKWLLKRNRLSGC
jgi:hypothetical protein